MNTIKKNIALFGLFGILLISCSDSHPDSISKTNPDHTVFMIDTVQSNIDWEGTLLGIVSHKGKLSLDQGLIEIVNGQVVGGTVVIDMSSIEPTIAEDLPNLQLQTLFKDHLSTEDFFYVEKYQYATFEILDSFENELYGNLNVHGVSRRDTIKNLNIEIVDGILHGNGNLSFTGDDYNLSYKHKQNDMEVPFDVGISMNIVASIQ